MPARSPLLPGYEASTTPSERRNFFDVRRVLKSITDRLDTNEAAIDGFGTWQTYACALSGAGWTIGDGTIDSRFVQLQKTVMFTVLVTFGSTSTFGAGRPGLSLPVAHRSSSGADFQGTSQLASGSGIYDAKWRLTSSTTIEGQNGAASGAYQQYGNITSAIPFTWTSGSLITVQGFYEAA
jgi:hypothetical protein